MITRDKSQSFDARQGCRIDQHPRWRARLPAAWHEMVVPPVAFSVFRDGEMAAERSFGYDARQSPCYYAHRYCVEEWRSDDDEEFYACTLYGESLAAWRLRDGYWLIHRIVRSDEHGDTRSGYSLSPDMPR